MSVYRPGRPNTSAGRRARRVVSVTLDGQPLKLADVQYVDTRLGVVRGLMRNEAGAHYPDRHGRLARFERRGRVVVHLERAR